MALRIGNAISSRAFPRVGDVADLQSALAELGYLRQAKAPRRGIATAGLFTAIQRFQRENDLTPDGVVNPDGPTERVINERLLERIGTRSPTTTCTVCGRQHGGVYTPKVCYDCFRKEPEQFIHLVPNLDLLDEKIRKMMSK